MIEAEVSESPQGSPNLPRATDRLPGEGLLPLGAVISARTPHSPNPPLEGVPGSCGASNTATESQIWDSGGYCGVSIDWLSVYQVHPSAPLLGAELLLFCDLETGEVCHRAVRGLEHRGSHDTCVHVRSDGRRIEVSGNPSRWGRLDNLYGLSSVEAAVEVFNGILRSLQLPEFTRDCRTYVSPWQLQGTDTVLPSGCVITRVDLCHNWAAGSAAAARSVVAALGSVVRTGRAGWVSPDGCTVAWGVGSRYVYTKYYLKGPELRKHRSVSDPEYVEQLADWCDGQGIVRQEVSLKSMYLKRAGLDRVESWTVQRIEEVMAEYSPHRDAGTGRCDYQDVQEHLEAAGVSRRRAQAAQAALYAYLAGHRYVVGENISKSAFYRLRADLKRAGVDIAAALNVSALKVRVREVPLYRASAPAFYRWAAAG